MMKKQILILLLLTAFGQVFPAGEARKRILVGNVDIRGARAIDTENILGVLGIRENGPLPDGWPETQLDSLSNWYRERGYFFFRADSIHRRFSPDSGSVDLTVRLNEGEMTRVGSFEIRCVDAFLQKKISQSMETRIGRPFLESILDKDIERILDFFENNGYPLARVQIQSLEFAWEKNRPLINILLNAEPGPLVRIQSVRVLGNTLTRTGVILRESRLLPQKPFSRKAIQEARDHLIRLGFFREVEDPEIVIIRNQAMVTLKIKEGATNTFDAVAGYNPPQNERDTGYFTGRIELGFSNLLGTGRFLEAYWEKKDRLSQAMRFGYEEPWFLGKPVYPGVRFRQEIRDTLYIEREWRFSLRFAPFRQLSGAIEAGTREIVIDSLGSSMLGLAQTPSVFWSAKLDYSTLDEPLNPAQGVRYHTEFTAGRKKNIGPAFLIAEQNLKPNVHTRSIRADVEAALPLWGRQVFDLGIHGAEIRSGDPFVPASDHIRFGGSGTLRGYPEDAFRGSLAAWFNAEYRYLFGRYSRAFVFLDGGMYQRREKEIGLVKGGKIGYGFGMRLETKLGIMGVDFGLGARETFLRGKVHVRLVNQF